MLDIKKGKEKKKQQKWRERGIISQQVLWENIWVGCQVLRSIGVSGGMKQLVKNIDQEQSSEAENFFNPDSPKNLQGL